MSASLIITICLFVISVTALCFFTAGALAEAEDEAKLWKAAEDDQRLADLLRGRE